MTTWIILGATSSMARALRARSQPKAQASCWLAATWTISPFRQPTPRSAAPAWPRRWPDARAPEGFQSLIDRLADEEGELNAAVFVGSMPAQAEIDADPSLIDGTVTDSFTGPARFLQMLAPLMEARGGGTVVGVGSVAGDRGRIGNYVYGAAKAGFATYLSGLRNRLTRAGMW
jgi:NAD(P)-dependent dehydrogenase (short-subunit alcohol dehydrogenase family)